MLHKYRNTTLFEAEQYDGSAEMRDKYEIEQQVEQLGPMMDFRDSLMTIGGVVSIEKGQWILTNDDGDYLVVDDDYFRETYERVEGA